MEGRDEEALNRLEDSEKVCEHLEMYDTLGKIFLMVASLDIKHNRVWSIKNNILEAEKLFKKTDNRFGRAETHLLGALW